MRFDIRNYFKTGKTPYTAQFSEDFSTENFDGSVILSLIHISEPTRH